MSLYGIDLLEKTDGDYVICEINGVCSGMKGFEKVYGDNRVKDQVNRMLEEKYGKITVNNGYHRSRKYRQDHPVASRILDFLYRVFPDMMTFFYDEIRSVLDILNSEKAFTDWRTRSKEVVEDRINDFSEKKYERVFGLPFERYIGQDSTVFNIVNEKIDEETVNDYVAEEITRNKLLQYNLLKESDVGDKLVDTVPIGLGTTKDKNVERYLEEYDSFVRKPVKGAQGSGIVRMDKEEVSELKGREGPITERTNLFESVYLAVEMAGELVKETGFEDLEILKITEEEFQKAYKRAEKKVLRYVEDYIADDNYNFELGLAVLQPFIDTKSRFGGDNTYSSIRAIVCNGEYVDSYRRVDSNPVVNLSRTADAVEHEEGNYFIQLCETAVELFENSYKEFSEDDFRKKLYRENFDRKKY